MAGWAAKRFWTDVTVVAEPGGFGIGLDNRRVKTPAKAPLLVPTEALAQAIAAEWQAQQGKIVPASMPFTRSANSAIDKVAPQRVEVTDLIAAYGDADLICYRATGPDRLVRQQAEAWDPLMAWSAGLGAPLVAKAGVMHVPQAPTSLAALRARVDALDLFALTAFHDLVSLSGSLVIGLALIEGLHPPERLWDLSRIDESWAIEVWGADEEAIAVAALKQRDFLHAAAFYNLSKG
jgi:chaperone required for assembly of F1-ATPase